MKAFMLFTGSGTLVILTSFDSATSPGLLARLKAKGIDKFVAREIPLELARTRYGSHFAMVEQNVKESDDLRILDVDGQRAFRLFRFAELGQPITVEPEAQAAGTP
jgi:hypothetical protein